MMTVRELIQHLKDQPQDLPVAYKVYSEQCLLRPDDIRIVEEGMPRDDGWIHNTRSDQPTQLYLMFPGN